MLLRASLRELLRHPLRTALAALGVAVATAMLVDMLMLGAGLERSFRELLRGRDYDLRVSPRGTLPFDTEATIDSVTALRRRLLAREGVAGVGPVLAANLLVREREGRASGPYRAFVVGVDPAEQGIYRLVEGRAPRGAGEVVVGSHESRAAGMAIGDRLRAVPPGGLQAAAGGTPLRVVGRAEFLYASRDDRPMAMRWVDLQRLTGREDRASFLMVRLRPGADPEAMAEALSAGFPGVEVVSVGELVRRAVRRLSYFRQLALILGTVSLVVAALLVGTVMAVSINERYGILAALRAIGISRRHLLVALAAESVALCAVAGLAGLGLGALVAAWLESILSDFPGLPVAIRFFVPRPWNLAAAYGLLLVVGAVAAVAPAWHATGLEIAGTLHREEP